MDPKPSERVLQKLDVKALYEEHLQRTRLYGRQLSGLCPFHNDRNPSLSANIETGLFYCHACGTKGNVFQFYMKLKEVDFNTALRELGAIAGVWNEEQQVTASYKYKDPTGKTLYVKERIEPGYNGRGKTFVFKHEEDGVWVKSRGCEPVPYNLPEVIQANQVFFVEGEGKVELLRSWGLVGTCLDSGARSPWKAEYTTFFENKEVVIVPDNDEPGKQYAAMVSSALYGVAATIKIVDLPGLQEGEDILDWKGE